MRTSEAGSLGTDLDTNCQRMNVGETERIVSAACGGALLMSVINVRPVRGLLGVLIGGTLLYRALTGHCPIYSALCVDRNDTEAEERRRRSSPFAKTADTERRGDRAALNKVDVSSEDSFPASDAPGWTRSAAT